MGENVQHAAILIPVFNKPQYLANLIESMKPICTECPIYLVDDASDLETKVFIQSLVKEIPSMTLITNEENRGFTYSVNLVLEQIVNNKINLNIILVNTDIELPQNAMHTMSGMLMASPNIASITSLCDAQGTMGGTPFIKNEIKNKELHGKNLELTNEKAKILSYFWGLRVVDIPTCIGYFTILNKNSIKVTGIFDNLNFNRGYGEENDWSFRATRLGFKHQLLNEVIVHHKVGASFAGESENLSKQHGLVLREMYSEYPKNLDDWVMHSKMEYFRFVIRNELIFEKLFLRVIKQINRINLEIPFMHAFYKFIKILAKNYIYLHLRFYWNDSHKITGRPIRHDKYFMSF